MLNLVLLILEVFPNSLLYVLDLVLKFGFLLNIFLSLLLDNSTIVRALLLECILFLIECFSRLQLFGDEFHVVFFKVDHFLEILEEIIQRSKILFIPCFIL